MSDERGILRRVKKDSLTGNLENGICQCFVSGHEVGKPVQVPWPQLKQPITEVFHCCASQGAVKNPLREAIGAQLESGIEKHGVEMKLPGFHLRCDLLPKGAFSYPFTARTLIGFGVFRLHDSRHLTDSRDLRMSIDQEREQRRPREWGGSEIYKRKFYHNKVIA